VLESERGKRRLNPAIAIDGVDWKTHARHDDPKIRRLALTYAPR
jgi:hypothetical protein